MAMDSTSASLACCLLVISFAVVRTQQQNLTITPAETTPGLNLTHATTTLSSYNSTGPTTVISNWTENVTVFSSTTRDTESLTTTTAATTQSTSLLQTSTLQTDTSLTTTTPAPTTQTTVGLTSTPDTTVITANSSHTGNATTDPTHAATQGLRLNVSEETMTIVFSVVLGVFALALVAFTFHRCKHKIQYFHQPLTDTGDTDAFVDDDDTLVISGGLYDNHPIYDNVPTVPADRSQFRLQFLH